MCCYELFKSCLLFDGELLGLLSEQFSHLRLVLVYLLCVQSAMRAWCRKASFSGATKGACALEKYMHERRSQRVAAAQQGRL